jgi:benzylsuccinate CoA-transferase BbsE subunit
MTQPYSGLRILDLTGIAGAYGTRLFASLGAEVIKLEATGGSPVRQLGPFLENAPDRERSLWWTYLAMGTKSVVLDPISQRDSLQTLIESCDVIFDDQLPEASNLSEFSISPKTIRVSVTPFGLSGSKRSWKSSNLVAWAASGVLYTTGFLDRPPVAPGGPAQLILHATALNAIAGAQIALRMRKQTGLGQNVDISMQEVGLSLAPETGLPMLLDDRVHRARTGNRRDLGRPFGLYPCSDGYVSIVVLMPMHWEAMAKWIHEETDNDTILEDVFRDPSVRTETKDLLDTWTEELTINKSRLELFEEGQSRGIPITPVNTISALANDRHLAASGYWETVELPTGASARIPGAPFRTNQNWWITARSPFLGEHTNEFIQ